MRHFVRSPQWVRIADRSTTDETGYEVLVGSEASDVASRIYSEKVFIMAKAFVTRALSEPPNAFKEIVEWLYYAPSGPKLLTQIIRDHQISSLGLTEALADKITEGNARLEIEQAYVGGQSWAKATGRLSAGARIPLEKHMKYLVEYEDSVYSETVAKASDSQADNEMEDDKT